MIFDDEHERRRSLPVPPGKPPVPVRPAKSDPWPDTPFDPRFRGELGWEESRDDYRAYNASGALGRYQLRRDALIDVGFLDRAGRWTGKLGVNSQEDFLDDPLAQEVAFAEYMRATANYLIGKPFTYKYIGQKVFGKKGTFEITESGLLAAAHREGYRKVSDYIQNLSDHAWVSRSATPADPDLATTYDAIETRLRMFADIPVWKPKPVR